MINYDPSREALYQPAKRPTVFGDFTLTDDGVCAELARLAYLPYERDDASLHLLQQALQRIGLAYSKQFSDGGTSTQAFGAVHSDGRVYLAFRGTEADDPTDILTDADCIPHSWQELPDDCKVHAGFSTALDSLWKGHIQPWLAAQSGGQVCITGHSLGAALATLAAALVPDASLVTFGSPRVGNDKFAARLRGPRVRRFVDCSDVVTMVTPEGLGYAHAGLTRYIDQHGSHRNWNEESEPDRIREDRRDAYLAYIVKYAWRFGDVGSRSLADHAPINYVRSFIQR